MKQEVDNFARFFAVLKRLPGADKETLVYQYASGRTDSLRQMTRREYDKMVYDMEQVVGYDERKRQQVAELKKQRSSCLHLMQRLGIDTSDWARVNDFCRHPRIAGKEFRLLRVDELEELQRKLRAIKRKGSLTNSLTSNPSPGGRGVNGLSVVTLVIPTDGKAS